jgi:16S rRNA processing protein RimM
LETGANNVYEVTTPEQKTILIPVIDQCILAHDLEAGTVTVHLLDGLLDVNA